MAEFLLELFSEEIPARMQAEAAGHLRRLFLKGLGERGFTESTIEATTFVTPRRLTLVANGLPLDQPDQREERKGPRTSAPTAAIEGFLRSTGMAREDLKIESDGKSEFYVAIIERKGRATADVLEELIAAIVKEFPWPKSMRWAGRDYVWVRPLRGIVALLAGKVVNVTIGDVVSGNVTWGHRLMAPGAIHVASFSDYREKLLAAKVVLDAEERKRGIEKQAKAEAARAGLIFRDDPELLDEVAGLVEWPVVLTGGFEKEFLDVPAEVLVSTMRKNQKYFALHDLDGRLANAFLVVANLQAEDGGKAIIAGNERVVRARLSDARFFWEQDKKITLAERLPQLDGIVFHAKLGTQGERVKRIEALAGHIAEKIGADPANARLAARLCKADLVSGTVGEFPEVQGTIGGYLAAHEKLGKDVAEAIGQHYRPVGHQDDPPANRVAMAVALADKLDTLTGFFAIDEKPTGSKDPYALRRAALGVIRILLTAKLNLRLADLADAAVTPDLVTFFVDRLKVVLRESGLRHDLADAAFAIAGSDNFVLLVARVEALQSFLATDDGKNLLAGYKRATNILRIEEKKDKRNYAGAVNAALLSLPQELALAAALDHAVKHASDAVKREDFAAAMGALSALRAPVDAFFEKVTVNDPDPALRENRLNLLARIKLAAHEVADFSKIEG